MGRKMSADVEYLSMIFGKPLYKVKVKEDFF